MSQRPFRAFLTVFLSLSLVLGSLLLPFAQPVAQAGTGITATGISTSPSAPVHAVLVGNLQTALGAASDWAPSDNTTLMRDPAGIGTYIYTGFLKAGTYEYKVALNGTWDVSYPGNNVTLTVPKDGPVTFRYNAATHEVSDTINNPGRQVCIASDFNGWTNNSPDYRLTDPLGVGAYETTLHLTAGHHEYKVVADGDWNQAWPTSNVAFDLATDRDVTFYYYDASHKVKDTASSADAALAVVASSFQSKVGAAGDWNPADLTTRLWDTDGSGTYRFQTYLPKGVWEYKVALNRGWAEAYPGSNVSLNVPADNTLVAFAYDAATHTVMDSINNPVKPGHDNDIWWNELYHNSRDNLSRSPFGAVPAGTPVTLRIQTAAGDLTAASVRLWDDITRTASLIPMQVSGHSADGNLDYWTATVSSLSHPGLFYYHFVLQDGTRSVYYYAANGQHGGAGAPSDNVLGNDYQITVYDPSFTTPQWLQNAVIYQIFPDRFNNGDKSNDPQPTDPDVYGNPVVLHSNWSDLPSQPPRGSDFFGGDLQGVLDKLDYLQSMGVQVIYFNPIFQAPSNHKYDTTDYMKIDPHFGDTKLFEKLTAEAAKRGMHVVLDGVFNHTGSDSVYFDKYSRYPSTGAFESQSSPYSGWYDFSNWPSQYTAWWGFDTLPKLIHMRDGQFNQSLENYIYADKDSVARHWLQAGAAGWRLDVPNEVANPVWPLFRQAVKETKPDAAIIGEIWDNASQYLLGNEFDSVMNYRFRDAVWNFFGSGSVNAQGFDDALASIREDYPAPAFAAMMNLVDSHDTARILNVLGENKDKLRLVAFFQLTYPGAPTIYYGDEAGVTGGPDPDSRRTYPWGSEDQSLLSFYRSLTHLRESNAALRAGDIRTLLADSKNGVYAFGRETAKQAAVVALNNSAVEQTVTVSLQGFIPDGTVLHDGLNQKQEYTVENGQVTATLGAYQGLALLSGPRTDLVPPAAPTGLTATAGNAQVALTWRAPATKLPAGTDPATQASLPGWANGVPGRAIAGYNVYRTTVSGGDYVRVNPAPITGTTFTDSTVTNATAYFYTVTALDAAGSESARSAEARAVPAVPIGWAGVVWPLAIDHTLSAVNPTPTVYAQVWVDGLTSAPGQGLGILAQLGYGPAGSDPHGAGWTWVPMNYDMDMGNNDQYTGALLPEQAGSYSVVARFSSNVGDSWTYTDPISLTVAPSGDTTAPATPTGLAARGSLSQIALSWDANQEPDLFGYEIYRSTSPFPAGQPDPALRVARVDGNTTTYTDGGLDPELTYYYTIVAVDTSFNRSPAAEAITARAQPSQVQVTLLVTVPDYTPAGDTVYVAGSFPDNSWNPGGIALTRVDATHWSTTLTLDEGTVIEYKYARGSWDQVEKDALGQEIANRKLVVANQGDGRQLQSDTVARWRDINTVVMAPADGFTTSDASITVTGNTVPGYTVTVNGMTVTPDAGGYFSALVDLAVGENTITVVGPAKDFSGTVTITRTVTRVQ